MMSQQLNLFSNGAVGSNDGAANDKFADLATEPNAIDEMFAAKSRYRNSHEFLKLLNFIARFPNYSAFNCFLLYIQNPSISYVATARTWARKYKRQLKFSACPLMILAPMAPVRFLYDMKDTEGDPISPELLTSHPTKDRLSAGVYEHTLHNCEIQGIIVQELNLDNRLTDTAVRMTPSTRKKHRDLNLKKDASYLVILDKANRLEEKYSHLALELGHIFCGHLGIDKSAWWPERHNLNATQEEIEAESVAFLICQRKGLFTSKRKYLSRYFAKDQNIPAFSLNAIFQAVNYIELMGKSHWRKPMKRSRY